MIRQQYLKVFETQSMCAMNSNTAALRLITLLALVGLLCLPGPAAAQDAASRSACGATATQQGSRPEGSTAEAPALQNLCAFTRLYGYVRYFHPSDAASATDWERFAIYGARQV